MRRQPLNTFTYLDGYTTAVNPLMAGTNSWADGSCNKLLLGDGYERPFRGYYTKGTNSGQQVSLQVGAAAGGLANYSAVTASGSLIKDAKGVLYTIGAGETRYEWTKIQIASSSFNLAANSDINTTTDIVTKTAHGLTTGQQIRISAATTMPTVSGTALSSTTNYFAIVLTSSTFKMAYTYTAAMAGTPIIDFTSQGVGTITFYTGSDFRASTILQSASVPINTNWYTYSNNAGLDQPTAPNVTIPTTPGTGYTGLINGAIAFKLGAIRDYANSGTNVDTTGPIPVKSIASTTSLVVVPVNKTVKIQFPTAQSGQTHWAVFATKQGFGGTGVFLRVGYRTSSATNAVWYWAISETTVAAAVGRTLEFDFQDGDLYPEEAWLFDYQPPPGTHFLRLENCGVVLGCYDGTVCAVSLPNFMESYNPFHLLYLPEPVTAVLHRLSDDYAYVAGRNSIHVLQYVGYRGDDIASATVTTISPDVGIAYQSNWAQCGSTIVAYLEGKGLVQMSKGGDGNVVIDYEFGKEVSNITSSWSASGVVVCWNPSTQSMVAGYGDVSVSRCFESGAWAAPVYNSDVGITGNWLSAVSSQGELAVSLDNSGTYTAYSYDNNTSTTRMPTVAMSRWQSAVAGARSNNIYEIESSIRAGTNAEPLIIGLHTNLFKTYVRTVGISSGGATVTASSAIFNDTFTNKWICIFGTDVGNRIFTSSGTPKTFTTIVPHNLYTGQCVTVRSSSGLPSPLVTGTSYYAIVLSTTTFRLAATLNDALNSTPVTVTTDGSGTMRVVVNYLIGRMTYASTTTVTLTNSAGSSQLAGGTVSGAFALIGAGFQSVTPYPNTEQSLLNARGFAVQNVREFCVSVYQATDAATGAVLTTTPFGTASQSSQVRTI